MFSLSNTALARGIGVDASQVSRWKSGERKMTANSIHLYRLSRYFVNLGKDSFQSTQMDDLIGMEQNLTRNKDDDKRVYALGRWLITEETEKLSDLERPILDKSPMGIALCRDSRIVYANDSFASLMGYEQPKLLVNETLTRLVDSRYSGYLQQVLHDVEKGLSSIDQVEFSFKQIDNSMFNAIFVINQVRLPDGQAVVVYVFNYRSKSCLLANGF